MRDPWFEEVPDLSISSCVTQFGVRNVGPHRHRRRGRFRAMRRARRSSGDCWRPVRWNRRHARQRLLLRESGVRRLLATRVFAGNCHISRYQRVAVSCVDRNRPGESVAVVSSHRFEAWGHRSQWAVLSYGCCRRRSSLSSRALIKKNRMGSARVGRWLNGA